MNWKINSWRNYCIKQIPHYNNHELEAVQKILYQKPPLININDINALKQELLTLHENNSFIIQIGECAETFIQCTFADITNRINLLQNFKDILHQQKHIITIGRIAGQYAKPRSTPLEVQALPVYRGDMIHDFKSRKLDANRLILAYEKSQASLNYINNYKSNIYTSHEALILPYEECFTYQLNHKYYNQTASMLWLGDKTCFQDSAHLEYLSGIENPIGIKISKKITPQALQNYINILNPDNHADKIILINRMGIEHIKEHLPPLLQTIIDAKLQVHWMCDPMHGNTFTSNNNYKTRDFNVIIEEIKLFHQLLKKYNVYFAGIHLEATYQNVTECIDNTISLEQLKNNYLTYCDPRLNKNQTINIALLLKELL